MANDVTARKVYIFAAVEHFQQNSVVNSESTTQQEGEQREKDNSSEGSRLELALAGKQYSELNTFINVSKSEYTVAAYSHVPYTH